MWGADRVGLLMGDVELVDVGPEHDFCHFEISALGAGELRDHSIFIHNPQGGLFEIPYPSEFYFSFFKVFPLGYLNPP